MKNRQVILSGIIVIALLCMAASAVAQTDTANNLNAPDTAPLVDTVPDAAENTAEIFDDIEPYNGSIGAGNPMYGLKVAMEDLDEILTFNETERFNKQLNNARLRLSEVKRELILNNTDSADRALDLYWQKVNLTQMRLSVLSSSNATGLLHAQEMATKHKAVLESLMLSHPDNTGLARAYNNSLALESKFEQKTRMRFERVMEKNNKTIVKAIRLTVAEQEHTTNTGENQTVRVQQTQKTRQAEGNGKDDGKGNRVNASPSETTAQPARTPGTPSPSATPSDTGKGKPDTPGNGGSKVKVTGTSDGSGNGSTGSPGNENRGQGNGRNK
ncbi:MAG: DUF5667 domain-containing protein [Methanoregula sp.]|nr:MAG: DUF5667 domain-containing protein [Methanoregula sp.]